MDTEVFPKINLLPNISLSQLRHHDNYILAFIKSLLNLILE